MPQTLSIHCSICQKELIQADADIEEMDSSQIRLSFEPCNCQISDLTRERDEARAELAALKERLENAPVAVITRFNQTLGSYLRQLPELTKDLQEGQQRLVALVILDEKKEK